MDVLYPAMTGAASWWDCVRGYLVPALIGNILGGAALVSALNHAWLAAGGNKLPE